MSETTDKPDATPVEAEETKSYVQRMLDKGFVWDKGAWRLSTRREANFPAAHIISATNVTLAPGLNINTQKEQH